MMDNVFLENKRFVARGESEGWEKTAEFLTTYLRDKVREVGVARRAFEPETVDSSQIDRNENDDIPRMIFDIEQGATAVSMNFRGKGTLNYFNNTKFSIQFNKIESEHFKKNKGELATVRMPIQEVLDQNTVYAMYGREDVGFRDLLDAATDGDSVRDLTASGTSLVKADLVSLLKIPPKKKGRPAKLIMTEDTFMDVLGWDSTDAGDDLVKEIVINGFQYKTLMGVPVITSINVLDTDAGDGVWNYRHIYVIPDKQYLGVFKLLHEATHEVKAEADELEFWSWEYPGMGLGNTRHVGRLELTT
ncbi:MAG: hypothetical protein SVK08_01850 [Halobacteriota archaeon]|nr:hypothetical protein [Halobacteriota archaeon]